MANVHGTPAARQQALTAFVQAFDQRWTAVTSCRRAYTVVDCGPAPLPAPS